MPRPPYRIRREDKWTLNGTVPVPCRDLMQWAMWMQTADRTVARTRLMGDEVLVSTVFLGLDHSFGGPRPILFETMVFGQEHLTEVFGGTMPIRDDMGQWRYSTWREAEEGHAKVVGMMQARITRAEELAKRAGRKRTAK